MDAEIGRRGDAVNEGAEHKGDLPCPSAPLPPCPASVSGQALHAFRTWAIQQAHSADIPLDEVDWLLQGVTPLDSLALRLGTYRDQATIFIRFPLDTLKAKWQQRLRDRMPVQYLVGETPWRSFMLRVTPAVLIPRPETELMIDIAREWVDNSPRRAGLERGVWVDLGTGSGAIALGLAAAFPDAHIIATDISAAALAIAQQNAERHQLADRIEFRQGAWFEPLTDLKGQLAGMVSNPPYIPSERVLTLQPEVTHHEPHTALDGGQDGLDEILHLVKDAPDYLVKGGFWLLEIMAGQAEAVLGLLQLQSLYSGLQAHLDLAGIQRFVSAYRS
ncbi:MAG: peptide chain release factor N(5)-glutamine methyltransferase [Cyanobacteria bacterium P01_F01_bin.4]